MSSKQAQTVVSNAPPGGGESSSKVKAACEECRTRKTKCDGNRPVCGRCQSKGRSCTYETEPNEFRITALKRRYAELAQSASNHEALVRLLRERDHQEALEILERIRSNESIVSILVAGKQREKQEEQTNLVNVIAQATSPKSAASQPTSPECLDESPAREPQPRRTTVDKQSVAFLCSTASASTPEPASKHQTDQITSSTSNDEPPAHESTDVEGELQLPLEKRRRLSEPVQPHRPGLPGHAWRSVGTKFEPLASRQRSHDNSWMKGLETVKAADWDAYYIDDHTFIEILKCYFVWENPSLAIVNEKSFWEGLIAGGSEFCNVSLVHGIIAFGAKIYSMWRPERASTAEHFALLEAVKLWDWDADATVPANASAGLLLHAIMTANGQDRDGAAYLSGALNLASHSGLFSHDQASHIFPDSDPNLSRARAEWTWDVFAYQSHFALTFNTCQDLFCPSIPVPKIDHEGDSREWEPLPLQRPSRPSLHSSKAHARARLWQIGSRILPLHCRYQDSQRSDNHWRDANALYKALQQWQTELSGRLNILHGVPPHVFSLHAEYYRCVVDTFRPWVNTDQAVPEEQKQRAHGITQEANVQLRLIIHQMELEHPGLPIPLIFALTPLVSVANEALVKLPEKGQIPTSDEIFYFNLCVKLMQRMNAPYPITRYLIIGFQQIANRQKVELPEDAKAIMKRFDKDGRLSAALKSGYPVHHDLLTTDLEASNLQSLIGETEYLSIRRELPTD